MGIYVRRGLEKDFDPEKMKPGEWAVSIDSDRRKQKIWMCFAPGIVKRMGTYEDFEDQIQDATEEIKQQYLTAFNEILTQIESDKNTATEEYAYVVDFKNLLDETYVPDISKSVTAASNSATAAAAASNSASTYRDNAKTYMDNANAYAKEAKTAASSITGALKPKGTIAFKDLPNLSTTDTGAMYNISDEFVSTDNFKDGGDITYPAGTNIYKTEDGMWDCLGGQLSDYLMRDDIDTAVEESMPDYKASSSLQELVAGESVKYALGKLKTAVKNVISLVKLLGTTDISSVGNGTVTGAISSLNSNLATKSWEAQEGGYVYARRNTCVTQITALLSDFNLESGWNNVGKLSDIYNPHTVIRFLSIECTGNFRTYYSYINIDGTVNIFNPVESYTTTIAMDATFPTYN